MLNIALVGKSGSGKTRVSKILSCYNFNIIETKSVVMISLINQGIKPTPITVRDEFLRIYTTPPYSVIPLIERKRFREKNVVDSVRSQQDLKYLRELGDTVVLHIKAPLVIRYQRIKDRRDAFAPKTLEELIQRDEIEDKIGMKDVISMADYEIINTDGVNLKEKIEEFLKWLKDYSG